MIHRVWILADCDWQKKKKLFKTQALSYNNNVHTANFSHHSTKQMIEFIQGHEDDKEQYCQLQSYCFKEISLIYFSDEKSFLKNSRHFVIKDK